MINRVELGSAERKCRLNRLGIIAVVALWTVSLSVMPSAAGPTRGQRPHELSFDERLDARIGRFDNKGRTLLQAILDLVYGHHLPTGLEYVNRDAVRRPVELKLQNTSVRETLSALVAQVPEYRISFSGGVVQIYSVRARSDSLNLLNTVIDDFTVRDMGSQYASDELFTALVHKVRPHNGVVLDTAGDPRGAPKLTLHLQKGRVYEILDALVAQDGAAIWVVEHPPEGLRTLDNLWHIYRLEPPAFKDVIFERLRALFPSEK